MGKVVQFFSTQKYLIIWNALWLVWIYWAFPVSKIIVDIPMATITENHNFLKCSVYFLNQKWAVFKWENKNNQIWTVAAVYVIISNLAIFSFDLEERYFSNNELTLILKIIGLWPQTCHAITNRNNNIWFEELTAIPVKMSVSTFYTDVILYFFDQVIC